jgi:hypothetical protein
VPFGCEAAEVSRGPKTDDAHGGVKKAKRPARFPVRFADLARIPEGCFEMRALYGTNEMVATVISSAGVVQILEHLGCQASPWPSILRVRRRKLTFRSTTSRDSSPTRQIETTSTLDFEPDAASSYRHELFVEGKGTGEF